MGVPSVRRLLARAAPAVTVAVVLAGVAGGAAADEAPFRYYESAVNLPPDAPGADGFAGSVAIRQVVGGAASVSVFLSRSTVVVCPDGEGTASTTIRTQDDGATAPGPVALAIDRLLREAHGDAVVDLVLEESPGCGAPETSVTLPAQVVSLDTLGTSPRFRSGVAGTVSSVAGSVRSSSEDLSRDGTGTATVGTVLRDAAGAAFLKCAVERTHVQGTPPQAPANAAPPGGVGATGAAAGTPEPPGGLGVVFRDVGVTATAGGTAGAATLSAFAEVHTVVACPRGGTALVVEVLEGAGTGSVAVDRRLATATATATGTLALTRTLDDGCAGEVTSGVADVPVSLSLTATGPQVRVRDVRFFETRGTGDQRTDTAYVARDAAGTVTVGDVSAPTGLASISRARR